MEGFIRIGLFAGALMLVTVACKANKYGKMAPVIEDHKKQLDAEPCSPSKTRKLSAALARADQPQEALEVLRNHCSNCEADDQVLEALLVLEEEHGDAEHALEAARKRYELAPSSPEVVAKLAELLDATGKQDEMLQLLIAQFGASPHAPESIQQLAVALEKKGEPCEALVYWTLLSKWSRKHRGKADTAMARLARKNECRNVLPSKSTELATEMSDENLYMFPAEIGGASLHVGYDTASGFTYLPKAALSRIKGAKSLNQRVAFATAYGNLEGDLYRLPGLRMGDVTIGPFDAVVLPRLTAKHDGMLGNTITSRFRMKRLDKTKWEIHPL